MTNGVIIWFVIAVSSFLAWDFGLRLYMRRLAIPFSGWRAGQIGYKEWIYITWRTSRGQPAGIVPWISAALLTNALLASITFVVKSA